VSAKDAVDLGLVFPGFGGFLEPRDDVRVEADDGCLDGTEIGSTDALPHLLQRGLPDVVRIDFIFGRRFQSL
jgi:hypothetical protein